MPVQKPRTMEHKLLTEGGGRRSEDWGLQAVEKALEQITASVVASKKLDAEVVDYVSAGALFQLSIKKTLLAMKVIEEPAEWNPRVSPPPLSSQTSPKSHLQWLRTSQSAGSHKVV